MLLMCPLAGLKAQDWSSPETESLMRTYVKQYFQVEGRVFGTDDYEPDPYPLQGANIKVTCMGDTTSFDGSAADNEGRFWVYIQRRKRIRDTRLRVTVSYLGMQTVDSIFDPSMTKESGISIYKVNLDSLVLRGIPVTTQEVEIVAELQRMYQRGDTIIFNADAYEMPTGSVLLDLVRRLPGLKYADGKMTYLGRDINEIRLNGDQFFKRDMSIALNNMPTDKIKSLKVYEVPDDTLNVRSDNHLVMDMQTKEPIDRTLFSNVALATTDSFDRYSVSVDASLWKDDGSELYGSFNRNTIPNEYSHVLREENSNGNVYVSKQFDKVSVNGSAYYESDFTQEKEADYSKMFMPDFTQNSVSENTDQNNEHSWNGDVGVNGRINNKMWYSASLEMSRRWSSSASLLSDSISNEGEGLVSATRQSVNGDSEGHSYNANSSFTWNFGKGSKYNLNVSMGMGHTDTRQSSINSSVNRFVQFGDSVRMVDHRISTPSNSNNYRLRAHLQRQMRAGYLGLGYFLSYNDSKSLQNYQDMGTDGSLSDVDSLYIDRRNSNMEHTVDLDYFYSDSLYRINLSAEATPVVMTIDNLNRIPGRDNEHIRYSGIRYQVSANFRVRLFHRSQIGVGYNGFNGLPGADQLSTVTDYRNPMNIREGNSNLHNSFSHNFNLEFQYRSWMRTTFNYGTVRDQITTLTRLDRKTGARITSPANINGSWNMREYLYLTYPFQDLSLGFTASHSLNHNVAYVQSFTDSDPKTSATDYHRVSLSLEGAYSDQFWMISGNVGYDMDRSKSDYLDRSNGGKRVTAGAEVTYQSSFGLGASTSCRYNHPFGYEMEAANRAECLWNISANYSFLKERQARISLTWRDILKSYNGFSASVTGTSWNESRTFCDTSMFVIAFSYRFNRFR